MKLSPGASKRLRANPRRAGWVQIGYMLLAFALSYLAGQILAKKNKSPIDGDKPTTLTTRGSYMTWFLGIRRVGPVFAWAGDRETKEEEVGGKGFGGGQEVEVYYEAGWHQLAVGPVYALHRIIQGGKTIFTGPITKDSHPSGTTVNLGREGSFSIYWGEPDQPINTFLGNASRVGVSSRWPHCCYVVWNKKRLSTSPNWPILDYEIERRPSQSILVNSQGWYEPTKTLDGPTYNVVDRVANANEDVGYLEITGNASAAFDNGRPARVTGNGMGTGDFPVLRTTVLTVQTGTTVNGYPIYETRTRVFFIGGTAGATIAGTVQAYSFATDDGANIAHALAEELFGTYPQGLELDPDGLEAWDLPSLELLGEEAETEGWRASLVSVDGEEADAVLGAALQDHGVMVPIDTQTGKIKFVAVRKPVGTLAHIPSDLFADELPEIETLHGEKVIDVIVFEFTDRDHDYGSMTIAIGDDGQASFLEHQRASKVAMPSTIHFDTAAKLAEQRSQEELAGGSETRLKLSRAARELLPGDAITIEGFDEVQRVTTVGFDPLSEQVDVAVIPDFYGVRRSDFTNNPGGGNPNFRDAELDELFAWVEVPEQLLGTEGMFLIVPRVRAHAEIVGAAIHLSRDNSTYTLITSRPGVATGGFLTAQFSLDTNTYLDQGPSINLKGPDASSILDLTADLTNWGLGRQVVAIVSQAGTELCYLKKATALGGGVYRLDGLLRARYDTRRLTHESGARVFIFQDTSLQEIQDILLVPTEDLYVKSQPSSSGGSVDLAAVPPYSEALRGKGLVPIDIENLRTTAPYLGTSSYATGDDVTVVWSYSTAASRNTGAGFQSAGAAIGSPTLKGSFIVELLTNANALVRTDVVTVPSITYDNTVLAAAPISEGAFKVRVTHSNNGYLSTPVTFTVTKV